MCAFVASCASIVWAQKVTVDPNSTSAARTAPVDDSDKRLLQEVTCDLGYTRLHYVIEDIAARTKVTIRCGASKDDWQTRDLPLVVCAKDVPLGRLLRSIADSTHTDLSAETIETGQGKQDRVYRVWFSAKSQAELDGYRDEERKASMAEQSSAWDALVDSVDLPDSAISKWIRSDPDIMGAIAARQALGRILRDLGPEAKAKIMAGQRLDLTLSSYGKPDLFRDLYTLAQRDAYHSEAAYARRNPTSTFKLQPPTEEQMDASALTIRSHTDPSTGQYFVNMSLYPVRNGDNTDTIWSTSPSGAISQFQAHIRDFRAPEPGKTVRRYPHPPDHISKELVPISLKPEDIAKSPALSKNVKLDLPTDRDVTYADVMTALAKASGLSIISEDFLSQLHPASLALAVGLPMSQGTRFSPLGTDLPKEVTVGDALAKLAQPSRFRTVIDWYIDEKSSLIVGRSPDWLRHRRNLLPESLLVYLRGKADSDGVELDDYSLLSRYDYCGEWVTESKDLYFLGCGFDFFWRFYERLSPQDRALAKSEAGLPLAKYDTVWIADFVRIEAESSVTCYGGDIKTAKRAKEEADHRTALFTDPDVVRTMTLRIKTRPSTSWTTYTEGSIASHSSEIPKGIDRHTYYPTVEGKSKDGQPFSIRFNPPRNAFPIYSPRREAELAEQRNKAAR